MNAKTIQKLIDEVKKEPFRKDYVLGMLETLLEGIPAAEKNNTVGATAGGSEVKLPINLTRTPEIPKENISEAEILEKQALERIKNVKDLAS